jgi:hypothetical protein
MSWLERKVVERPCRSFVIGAALLALQFVCSIPGDEPYPVLRLPWGAAVVRDGDPGATDRWTLFAVTDDGRRIPVDHHRLLAGFPAQYREPILRRGFGLLRQAQTSAGEAAEARRWIRSRLRGQIERDDIAAIEITRERTVTATPTAPERLETRRATRIALE